MPELPEDKFLEAVHTVVARNLDLVPPFAPYGGAGSLYIRPTMIASCVSRSFVSYAELTLSGHACSGAELALVAPQEFVFFVYVTPLGSLYGSAGGKAPAVDSIIVEEYDRAAPKGTGPSTSTSIFPAI